MAKTGKIYGLFKSIELFANTYFNNMFMNFYVFSVQNI